MGRCSVVLITQIPPTPSIFVCNSYSTAIAVFPPESLHNKLNLLRSVYDKSFPRWAPHITVMIPFVSPRELANVANHLHELFEGTGLLDPWEISFEATGYFNHKDSATVFLQPDEAS